MKNVSVTVDIHLSSSIRVSLEIDPNKYDWFWSGKRLFLHEICSKDPKMKGNSA